MIKSHALVEAAVAHLVTAALREPRLNDVVAWLELSNSKTGKLAIVESLGLLQKPHRRFIRKFSELRNQLVHDVRNVNFTFAAHLEALDSAQKRAFAEAFGGIFANSQSDSGTPFRKLADRSPRFLVWASVIIIVSIAHLVKVRAELEARRADIEREIATQNAEDADVARVLFRAIADAVRERGEFVIRAKAAEPPDSEAHAT